MESFSQDVIDTMASSLEIYSSLVSVNFVENDGELAKGKQTLMCPELSNPNSSE